MNIVAQKIVTPPSSRVSTTPLGAKAPGEPATAARGTNASHPWIRIMHLLLTEESQDDM